MKFKAFMAVLGILALAGSAWACEYTSFMADADCFGWSASGTNIVCGSRDTLAYEVNLKQNGTIVATFSAIFVVWESDPTWSFNVPWGMELCGDYVAEGHFYYISPGDVTSYRDFSIPFTCECNGDVCHFTPGYWKNHAEAWPVTSLWLGCTEYSQMELLAILNTPVNLGANVILAHHLIAAKLNVANGADDSINSAIAEADRLLCLCPVLTCTPDKPTKAAMIAVKDILCAYNELILPGCEEEVDPYLETDAELSPAAPADESSWGAIKSIYR